MDQADALSIDIMGFTTGFDPSELGAVGGLSTTRGKRIDVRSLAIRLESQIKNVIEYCYKP